ncbi:MAG: hypothetical protein QW404_00345, partial [Candidatus Nanoarchaeia archaeon]
MRDNFWLASRLDRIWYAYFYDVERANNVFVRFKGRWKNKFGHISMKNDHSSEIVVNSLFRDERIPEGIIDATIAHEIIHYMHGFQSPHKRMYKHPHAGGIVTREMKRRGFAHIIYEEREFVQRHWLRLYNEITKKKPKSFFS